MLQRLKDLFNQYFELTRIDLEPGGEMIRPAVGRNKYRWYVRLDLWYVGYRITKRNPIVTHLDGVPLTQKDLDKLEMRGAAGPKG